MWPTARSFSPSLTWLRCGRSPTLCVLCQEVAKVVKVSESEKPHQKMVGRQWGGPVLRPSSASSNTVRPSTDRSNPAERGTKNKQTCKDKSPAKSKERARRQGGRASWPIPTPSTPIPSPLQLLFSLVCSDPVVLHRISVAEIDWKESLRLGRNRKFQHTGSVRVHCKPTQPVRSVHVPTARSGRSGSR